MHFGGEEIIFFGALLVLLSIIAGIVSNRLGAPLLLVFLGLGMLAGEDGPGGILFDNFRAAYLVGSVALAVILFDGGLRTERESINVALSPALALATVGVVLTAAITGLASTWLLGVGWLGGFLVGATVASTDAAAVFLLLHLKGTDLKRRVGATLELESGINDPMAVFLTVACVEILLGRLDLLSFEVLLMFLQQMLGGALLGIGGGFVLVWLLNRLEIAAGLYPILALAVALLIFAGANLVDASGFLAIYLAGVVAGNQRHRAAQVISRFHDGMAWLSQIGMFLMLGVLVTPHELLADVPAALGIALVLILVARPLAVWLCLLPFHFTWQETAFIAWVGLRGAVPIFLATIPVLAGLPGGLTYFSVAFVVVLASLLVQGWTVTVAARALGLELPAAEGPLRLDLNMLTGFDRDIAGYKVAESSPALSYPYALLPLPKRTRIISVIREGVVMNREQLSGLLPDDYVLAVAPPEQVHILDALFAARPRGATSAVEAIAFGEFTLDADVPVGTIAKFYSFDIEPEERAKSLAAYMLDQLPSRPVVGDRVQLGPVELVVRRMSKGRITQVGIELEPEPSRFSAAGIWRRVLNRLSPRGLLKRMAGLREKL